MMFRLELITSSSYMGVFPVFHVTHGIPALIQNGISFGENLVVHGRDSSTLRESQYLEEKYGKLGNYLIVSFLMREKGIA